MSNKNNNKGELWIIFFILFVIFGALFYLSRINKKRLGPARHKTKVEEQAFCKVHGKKIGLKECNNLFVGLSPAVWDYLKDCDGKKEVLLCKTTKLCIMGNGVACIMGGKIADDPVLISKGCSLGYDGPECKTLNKKGIDLLSALDFLTPQKDWSFISLAYLCQEGKIKACSYIPYSWFKGKVSEVELIKNIKNFNMLFDACLFGDIESCGLIGKSLNYIPLQVYRCLYSKEQKNCLGEYFLLDIDLKNYFMLKKIGLKEGMEIKKQ